MIIFLNEENSELRGKMFPIPDGVMKHLKKVLKTYEDKDGDKENKGYDHLKWLTEQEKVSTEELKRTKNFFDNYKGTTESDDYKLYGGKPMSDWVNAILKQAAKSVKDNKKANKDAGLSNTERKAHEKNGRLKVGEPTTASKKAKELSTALNENQRCVILSEKQFKHYLIIKK
jgi:hypothetical protein